MATLKPNGIDGVSPKQWSMWFNWMIHQNLTFSLVLHGWLK